MAQFVKDTRIGRAGAVFAFFGWLTGRGRVSGPFSRNLKIRQLYQLGRNFCIAQGWDRTTEEARAIEIVIGCIAAQDEPIGPFSSKDEHRANFFRIAEILGAFCVAQNWAIDDPAEQRARLNPYPRESELIRV